MGKYTGKVCEAATKDDKMCKKPAEVMLPKGTWLPWDVYMCKACKAVIDASKVRKK